MTSRSHKPLKRANKTLRRSAVTNIPIRCPGFSRLTGQQGTTGSAVKATQEDVERVGFPVQSAGTGKLVFASCIALKHVWKFIFRTATCLFNQIFPFSRFQETDLEQRIKQAKGKAFCVRKIWRSQQCSRIWIRIRMLLSSSKISKKNLDFYNSTVLRFLYDFVSFEEWCKYTFKK